MTEIPALNKVELWYLEIGLFFLHGISMAVYVVTTGWTQEFNGVTGVKWRRILHTNGASLMDRDTYILEAQGVPLRYKNHLALEALLKPFGTICRVISDDERMRQLFEHARSFGSKKFR